MHLMLIYSRMVCLWDFTSKDKNDANEVVIGKKTVGGKTVPDTILSISKLLALRDKRLVQTIDTAVFYVGRASPVLVWECP